MPNLEATRRGVLADPPRRDAPFTQEPGFYEPAGLWMYGNVRLLQSGLACIHESFGPDTHSKNALDAIERESERIVLAAKILVCGIHNQAHQRAAIVPLRWGAPRVLVFSGGFFHHLGENLTEEPFRTARLWRYQFDSKTDLVISRRAPDKKPTFARHNPTVDRLVSDVVNGSIHGLLFTKISVPRQRSLS